MSIKKGKPLSTLKKDLVKELFAFLAAGVQLKEEHLKALISCPDSILNKAMSDFCNVVQENKIKELFTIVLRIIEEELELCEKSNYKDCFDLEDDSFNLNVLPKIESPLAFKKAKESLFGDYIKDHHAKILELQTNMDAKIIALPSKIFELINEGLRNLSHQKMLSDGRLNYLTNQIKEKKGRAEFIEAAFKKAKIPEGARPEDLPKEIREQVIPLLGKNFEKAFYELGGIKQEIKQLDVKHSEEYKKNILIDQHKDLLENIKSSGKIPITNDEFKAIHHEFENNLKAFEEQQENLMRSGLKEDSKEIQDLKESFNNKILQKYFDFYKQKFGVDLSDNPLAINCCIQPCIEMHKELNENNKKIRVHREALQLLEAQEKLINNLTPLKIETISPRQANSK